MSCLETIESAVRDEGGLLVGAVADVKRGVEVGKDAGRVFFDAPERDNHRPVRGVGDRRHTLDLPACDCDGHGAAGFEELADLVATLEEIALVEENPARVVEVGGLARVLRKSLHERRDNRFADAVRVLGDLRHVTG